MHQRSGGSNIIQSYLKRSPQVITTVDILYTHALRVKQATTVLNRQCYYNERFIVSTVTTSQNTLLPKYIQQYSKQYPSLSASKSKSGNGENIYQDLLHNAIDIAFIENMISSSEVVVPFLSDELVLSKANDHLFLKKRFHYLS